MAEQGSSVLLYEAVLDHLKGRLLSGELGPGDRLPTVVTLARQFGVAPTSVREAYRILESMGILDVTRGRGTFVKSTLLPTEGVVRRLQLGTGESMADFLETWRILKPEIAALAARRATEAEAEAILAVALEMERVGRAGPELARLDYRFDDLIFVACHNAFAARILHAVTSEIDETERMTRDVPGHIARRIRAHKLIALAIKERNPEAARAFMYQHVVQVERELLHIGKAETPNADAWLAEAVN